ncbi:mechanosensitive ion channel [Marinilabiliaceae bacterium ANBcel2]|nr:mechanosensitive ion channel [Marinilabiliaceae bacterium ANBcel2]
MIEEIIKESWLRRWLQSQLENMHMPDWVFLSIDFSVRAIALYLISSLVYFVSKKVALYYLVKLLKRTKSKFCELIVSRRVPHRFSHASPAIIILLLSESLFIDFPDTTDFIKTVSLVYLTLVIFWSIQAILKALEDLYNTKPFASERPIKTYMQVIVILSYFICFLILLEIIFNIQVTRVFAGLGAMAAVLMLIFRDSILGFVAGIQLTANKMVRVGDWVSMPGYNADGDVMEITLNTVKVKNWDQTITTIPTYAMVSSPFVNWRGMEESGGRRIMRSVNIDIRSVKFCTNEMIEKYKKIEHLNSYINSKQKEIEDYNKKYNVDSSVLVNGRRMTNLGVFRKYLENYIIRHPRLNTDMIYLIRHLQPSEKGVPLEIYVFSKEQAWVRYEEVQADLFDHVLAVISEFDLKVFQLPSGDDVKSVINSIGSK